MKYKLSFFILFLTFCNYISRAQNEETVTIQPKIFEHALNNPLKGFRPGLNTAKSGNHPYNTVVREYLKWNELERNENDSIQQIIKVCNQKWGGIANKNIKIIPRVYLDWDEKIGNEYWPADMKTGDYSSDEFEQRLTRLVRRLGKVWDEDPRIAWIQMGIIGYWGEHHHPAPTERHQELLGNLFAEAFKNKKVIVRHPFDEFTDYPFGWYWDSFAHWNQISSQANPMMANWPDRWKTAPIEGETAYNWGEYYIQPGSNPNETLVDPDHRKWLINWIRKLHCTALGWVASFDVYNPNVLAGAEEVQKAFGYRFMLKEVSYPKTIQNNQSFTVSFKVENTGSAPFYYDWPVELRILNPVTHEVKWKQVFNEVDIKNWMPGDSWNDGLQKYQIPAEININTGTFKIDSALAKGKYILALSILDPGGMVPAVKFATSQYFKGGMHPIGYIGIDSVINQVVIDSTEFDNPFLDKSLLYSDKRDEIIDDVPSQINHKPVRKSFGTESWNFPGDSLFAWQYDYLEVKSEGRYFAQDSAQTIGLYGCNDTTGLNIRSYRDSVLSKNAAQFKWDNNTQTFVKNGQWLEYSVVFDIDEPYQLLLKTRKNVDANFKLTIYRTKSDTIFLKNFNLQNDFQKLTEQTENIETLLSKIQINGLWGAYTIRFDWYDNIGEPGIFSGFSFVKSTLDITPPQWYYVSVGTIPKGANLTVMTTEDAKIYLVPEGTSQDISSIVSAAVASIEITSYTQSTLETAGIVPGNYVVYAIDSANNISEASRVITLQTPVNTNKIYNNSEIKIAYNPLEQLLFIKSNHQLNQINIYDIMGKKVKSVSVPEKEIQLKTSHLKSGIYIVHASDSKGVLTTKKFAQK